MAALTASSLRLASGASTGVWRTAGPPAALPIHPSRRVVARAAPPETTTPVAPPSPSSLSRPADLAAEVPSLTTWKRGEMKTPGLEWWYIAAIFVPVAALIALPLAMNAGAPPPSFAPPPNLSAF